MSKRATVAHIVFKAPRGKGPRLWTFCGLRAKRDPKPRREPVCAACVVQALNDTRDRYRKAIKTWLKPMTSWAIKWEVPKDMAPPPESKK